MDQEDEKPKVNPCLMDAIDSGAYAEWMDHPATKLLLGQLREDIETCKNLIIIESQALTVPNVQRMSSLGAQLSARQALLYTATERSNG